MPPTRSPGIRLDPLLQSAREPVFWLGPDRRILQVNRAWEELTGHPIDQVAGLECLNHGPTRAGDLRGLGGSFCPPPEALAGLAIGVRTMIIHASGERLWRRVEFWPFHDAKGSLTGLLGLVHGADERAMLPDSAGHRLRIELLQLRDRLQARHGSDTLIGRGPEHRRILEQVAAAASTAVPILIVGEGGTGKHLVARTIHQQGARRESALAAFDCKALPPEVLERELFGSQGDHPGHRPHPTGHATRLIGDILDLPRDLQARLASEAVDRIRLIATTSGDPEAALRSGQLRADLFYTLTTIVIRLRPLRERLDELPLLAQHFLERANMRGQPRRDGFSPDAMDALTAYDWPGNLRELSRVVEEAHARGVSGMIQLGEIPGEIRGNRGGAYRPPGPTDPATLKEMLTQVERRLIERALERAGRNKSRAAKLLGINRPLLYRRIKELGIPDEPDPTEELSAPTDLST